MNKMDKKRKTIIAVLLIATMLIGILSTYAFFITQAGRDEQQKLTIKTGTLALTFEDNDEGLTANIELGKSYFKELTIRNMGTEAVTTNMIWSNLVNTYLEESLSYTLEYKTSEDGEWQAVETSHTNVPQIERAADYNLATDLTIPANTTYYYKVTITFNNLPDMNQESDKTATLSAKFRLGEEVVESKSFKTLAHLKLVSKEGNPNFAEPSTIDETADGLYSLEDDYGTSYYYRGAVENNYVKFGGFYWRIVRINGDGSIRMQYDGTRGWPNGNGQESFTTSGTDRFTHTGQVWNTNHNDAKYVGWMYGPAGTTASWTSDAGSGYGKNPTAYGATARIGKWITDTRAVKPQFTCEQKGDAFTVSDTTKGNGALTYPIGLITADEILAAGSGKFNNANGSYYLFKISGYWYWSFSPYDVLSTGQAGMIIVDTVGNLADYYVYGNGGSVATVINIAPEYAITMTGSGTMESPYQIPGVT